MRAADFSSAVVDDLIHSPVELVFHQLRPIHHGRVTRHEKLVEASHYLERALFHELDFHFCQLVRQNSDRALPNRIASAQPKLAGADVDDAIDGCVVGEQHRSVIQQQHSGGAEREAW